MEDPVATCVHAVLTFGWILIIFLTFSKKIVYENTSKTAHLVFQLIEVSRSSV